MWIRHLSCFVRLSYGGPFPWYTQQLYFSTTGRTEIWKCLTGWCSTPIFQVGGWTEVTEFIISDFSMPLLSLLEAYTSVIMEPLQKYTCWKIKTQNYVGCCNHDQHKYCLCDCYLGICHINRDKHVDLHRDNSKNELSFSFLFCLVVFWLWKYNTFKHQTYLVDTVYYGLKFLQGSRESRFLTFK